MVKVARNRCQHTQLRTGQFAVWHCYTQHGRKALNVPTVLQTQWLELDFRQMAVLPARELIAKLLGPQLDKLGVKFSVLVHGVLSNMSCGVCLPGQQFDAHACQQGR